MSEHTPSPAEGPAQGPVPEAFHRRPYSFVRRGDRLTARRQKAWDDWAPTRVLDVPRVRTDTSVHPDHEFDAAAAFGREAPLVVEVGSGLGEARTAAVNTLVATQLFYLLNARFLKRSSFGLHSLRGNPALLIATLALACFQLAFTYLPSLQGLFGSAPLDGAHWLSALISGVVVFVLVEIEKAVLRSFEARHA